MSTASDTVDQSLWHGPDPNPAGETRVLAVDLDGTLLLSDMLYESFWAAVAAHASALPRAISALRRGRAALKELLAKDATFDPATLPYDDRVLKRISAWRAAGGRTALVTATNTALANKIAAHLGIFDEVHGSDGSRNLKGATKAALLAEIYGRDGHVYVGDSRADLDVWRGASAAVTVGASTAAKAALDSNGPPSTHLPAAGGGLRAIIKELRPHQWLKNALVAVPLIVDFSYGVVAIPAVIAAFVSLSLVASAGYVLNDLLDLTDDRAHPRKRNRPFASGALSAQFGTAMVPALLLGGLGVSALISPLLLMVVALYFVATVLYSIKLKRHSIVDICMLAFLYTVRIIAGGLAIGAYLSVWLLAFSMFVFFSLAAIKRLAELSDADTVGRAVSRRGYVAEDRPVLSQIAVSAGFLGVLVLALYVDQPDVQERFGAPWLLWGVCPLLVFWLGRMALIAGRGEMHDDPLVWALQNRTSRLVVICIGALMAAAVLS